MGNRERSSLDRMCLNLMDLRYAHDFDKDTYNTEFYAELVKHGMNTSKFLPTFQVWMKLAVYRELERYLAKDLPTSMSWRQVFDRYANNESSFRCAAKQFHNTVKHFALQRILK